MTDDTVVVSSLKTTIVRFSVASSRTEKIDEHDDFATQRPGAFAAWDVGRDPRGTRATILVLGIERRVDIQRP